MANAKIIRVFKGTVMLGTHKYPPLPSNFDSNFDVDWLIEQINKNFGASNWTSYEWVKEETA